jgi:hypothetical protein
MALKVFRLITILLTALSMGVALAHLLEMPAKLRFDGTLWLTLLQRLYPPGFGRFGAAFEGGAVVALAVLPWLMRRRGCGSAFGWTLAATIAMISAHAVFWVWVSPVNSVMQPLNPATLPPDWITLRDQWEYAHATRALLQIGALSALLISLLVEIPDRPSRPNG